jgi:hypothetical protein
MYKIISLVVCISISFMPVAIASEVPFYLRDKSPLPARTVDPKNHLYIPKKVPYADWLVKRSAEVSAKLDDCYKELDQYKDPKSEKEKVEKNWVEVKIAKKAGYLKYLNDKFAKITGTSMSDAGYDFFSKETKEKFDVSNEKCSTPTGQKSAMTEIQAPIKDEKPEVKEVAAPIQSNPTAAPMLFMLKDVSLTVDQSQPTPMTAPLPINESIPPEAVSMTDPLMASIPDSLVKDSSNSAPMSTPVVNEALEKKMATDAGEKSLPASTDDKSNSSATIVESIQLKDPDESNQDKDNKDVNIPQTIIVTEQKISAPAEIPTIQSSSEPMKDSATSLNIVEENRKAAAQQMNTSRTMVVETPAIAPMTPASNEKVYLVEDKIHDTKTLVIEKDISEKPVKAREAPQTAPLTAPMPDSVINAVVVSTPPAMAVPVSDSPKDKLFEDEDKRIESLMEKRQKEKADLAKPEALDAKKPKPVHPVEVKKEIIVEAAPVVEEKRLDPAPTPRERIMEDDPILEDKGPSN